MVICPDGRILVAIMNNIQDWQRVLDEGWYRIPVKHAPPGTPILTISPFIKRSSVHNEETLGSVHNRPKSHFFTLSARFVLDLTQLQPVQYRLE